MTAPRISVVLATFNGEQFLAEQLESLLNQTWPPSEIVVGDDGSTDATMDILHDYARSSSVPIRIFRNDEQLGFDENFLSTAKHAEGDWIAWCDQDDVWLPTKLEAAGDAICAEPTLNLVLQNAWVCGSDLSMTGRRFPNRIRPGFYGANSQFGFWVWPGLLQTFRAEMVSRLDSALRPASYFPEHQRQSHDKWVCMIGNALGKVRILAEPVALYRRHGGAVTGVYQAASIAERVAKARNVGSEHYRFLSHVGRDSADALNSVAERADRTDWRTALSDSARWFDRLARLHDLRADMYGPDSSYSTRVRLFRDIWKHGGYVGQPFTAMGIASAVKDLAAVSGLSPARAHRLQIRKD